jgi:hypothetical protein
MENNRENKEHSNKNGIIKKLLLFLVMRSMQKNFTTHCICIAIICSAVFLHKTELTNIRKEGVNWIHLTKNRDW